MTSLWGLDDVGAMRHDAEMWEELTSIGTVFTARPQAVVYPAATWTPRVGRKGHQFLKAWYVPFLVSVNSSSHPTQ